MRIERSSRECGPDLEALILSLSLYAAVGALVWFQLRLPVPGCPFRHITGIPCLSCGVVRASFLMIHGDFSGALIMNPLFFLLACVLALFDIYAALVIVNITAPVRLKIEGSLERSMLRTGVVVAIVLNWAYLVRMKDTAASVIPGSFEAGFPPVTGLPIALLRFFSIQ